MYCKACGKKIISGTVSCPHCGRSVDLLSGGTGFWDIHESGQQKASQAIQPTDQPQKGNSTNNDTSIERRTVIETTMKKDVRKNRRTKLGFVKYIIGGIIAVALLVTHIVILVNDTKLRKDISELKAEQRILDERVSAFENQNEGVATEEVQKEFEETTTPIPSFNPASTPTETSSTTEKQDTGDNRSMFNLRIEGAEQDEEGVYLISENATATWDSTGADKYYITIKKPDGEFLKVDNVIYDKKVANDIRQQKIMTKLMEDPGEYTMRIDVEDENTYYEEIRFKKLEDREKINEEKE